MTLIFLLVVGLALLAAGFIGVRIGQHLACGCQANCERLLNALVMVDCTLVVLVVWTLPLWAPTWLR